MPELRQQTKLVAAITALVMAIVITLACLYISDLVKQNIREADNSGLLVCQQVFAAAKGALDADLSNAKIDPQNSVQLAAAVEEILQTDSELDGLLDSSVANSPTISDIAILDASGRAVLHTNPAYFGMVPPARQEFSSVANASIQKQLGILYGPAQFYDVRYPLVRGGKPFGEVRVGVSTLFL